MLWDRSGLQRVTDIKLSFDLAHRYTVAPELADPMETRRHPGPAAHDGLPGMIFPTSTAAAGTATTARSRCLVPAPPDGLTDPPPIHTRRGPQPRQPQEISQPFGVSEVRYRDPEQACRHLIGDLSTDTEYWIDAARGPVSSRCRLVPDSAGRSLPAPRLVIAGPDD